LKKFLLKKKKKNRVEKRKKEMFYLKITSVILCLVAIDRYIQHVIVVYVKPKFDVQLVKNVLHLTYIKNEGIAFGLLKNRKEFLWYLPLIVLLICGYLLYARVVDNKISMIGIIFILAGGLGNVIDRVFYGYVVDYVNLKFINFPIFNFADVCVFVGSILLICVYYIQSRRVLK
jgi:signal peptidase II